MTTSQHRFPTFLELSRIWLGLGLPTIRAGESQSIYNITQTIP